MTGIVGVHGVGNYVPGQPAEKVAIRRSADWATSVAAGLGMRPDALDLTIAYYAPLLHAKDPVPQAGVLDPDQALNALDPDTNALVSSWLRALDLPGVTVQGRLCGTAPACRERRGGSLWPQRSAYQALRRRLLSRGRLLPSRRGHCCPHPGARERCRHHRRTVRSYCDRPLPRHGRCVRSPTRTSGPTGRPSGYPRFAASPARRCLPTSTTPAFDRYWPAPCKC